MKFYNKIIKLIFFLVIMFFWQNVSAQANNDLFRKVVIFNLLNVNENLEKNYFSEIISKDIARDLERTGKYFVETEKVVIAPLKVDSKDYETFLKDLKTRALKHSADYLVVGQYKTAGKQIFIRCEIFIVRLNKIISLNVTHDNLGIFLSGLIDELSQKIDEKMTSYTIYKTNVPKIIPQGGVFHFYKEITIKSKGKNSEIWYSLDGSNPVRESKKQKKKSGKSYKYTGPFKIFDSVTIKAVSYKEGYNKSDIAQEHYRIKDPSSHLALGYRYGQMKFFDPYNDISDSSGTILTTYGYWELANVNQLKTNKILRNFAIYGALDSVHVEIKEDETPGEIDPEVSLPLHFNYWALYGGLMYKIRFGDMFAINLMAGGGMAYAQFTSDKSYDGFKNYYVRPSTIRQWTAPYFSSTISAEFTLGFIFFEIGTSYKYLFFNDAEDEGVTLDSMKAVAYFAGVGLKF